MVKFNETIVFVLIAVIALVFLNSGSNTLALAPLDSDVVLNMFYSADDDGIITTNGASLSSGDFSFEPVCPVLMQYKEQEKYQHPDCPDPQSPQVAEYKTSQQDT